MSFIIDLFIFLVLENPIFYKVRIPIAVNDIFYNKLPSIHRSYFDEIIMLLKGTFLFDFLIGL